MFKINTLKLALFFCLFFVQANILFAQTFFSQGSGNFSTLTNWNTIAGGGGANPVAGDLTSGLKNFVVQNANVVIIDQDINVLTLQTTNTATITFGNNGTARTATIQTDITIGNNTFVNVGATAASHILTVKGNFTNNGSVNLAPTSSRVVNLNLNGSAKSITGANTPILNNVTFNSSAAPAVSYTAGVALDINGSVTINANGVFNDGGLTHTVAGNWFQTNLVTSFVAGATGTIIFDGSSVQSIGGGAPYNVGTTFNNLTIASGQVATINTACTINGNFVVNNNSSVSSAAVQQTYNKGFSVTAGSTYTTPNTTLFNGTATQTIDFSNATFVTITFSNTGTKNTSGTPAANITGLVTISNATTVNGNVTLVMTAGLRIAGTGACNWSGTLTFQGGTIDDNIDNILSIGTADIIINGGTTTLSTVSNDAVTVGGNFTITSTGAFVVASTSSLIGTGNTLTLNAAANLFCREANSFPTGFTTVTLDPTSIVSYDGLLNQTIRGNIIYGHLLVGFNTGGTNPAIIKTPDNPLNIDGNLFLRNGVTLSLNGLSHTLAGDINNSAGAANGIIIPGTNTGTFTLDNDNLNQAIDAAGTGSYTFNNLSILQAAPIASRTKTFNSNITINGNFSASNPGGTPTILLNITLGTNNINAAGAGNTFTLGSDVMLNLSHADFGATTMTTFEGAITLNPTSIFNYQLAGAQTIASGFIYGSLDFGGSGNKTATASLDINGFISISGGTPIFVDGGFAHTVAGDWLLQTANYTTPLSTITLDGANQSILTGNQVTNFKNLVSAGTGTKTMVGLTATILGDFTINNGNTFDAAARNINIGGNWLQGASGIFTQTTAGTTTFNGATANQTLSSNSSSFFGNITINKPTINRLVTVNTYCDIDGTLNIFGTNSAPVGDGAIDFSNQQLFIGGSMLVFQNTALTSLGSSLFLDGASAQSIRMECTACSLNNVEFDNAGTKTVIAATGSIVDINGNVNINGATLNGQTNNMDFTVAGDWTNTGVFQHTGRTVTFDGANQTIGSSTFGSANFAGTLTKTLSGTITLSNNLTISTNATLDVGAGNNGISVGGNWSNFAAGAVFNPRQGSVTFNGTGTQNIYTGSTTAPAASFVAIGAGKSFFDLIINKTAGTFTLGDGAFINHGDLNVTNDFTITAGSFTSNTYDIFVAGNFVNAGNFVQSSFNSVLVFLATSGTKNFTVGTGVNTFRDIFVNATGATYTVQNNITITNNNAGTTGITINGGTFDLNGKTLSFITGANINVLTVNAGGTFNVGAGGTVLLANDNDALNAGGIFKVVGTSSSLATFSRFNSTGYCVTQTSGTFHAKFYKFEFLNQSALASQTGLTISGGSIDATNNFSEGTFMSGFAASGYYLDLTNFGGTFTAKNVLFNSGPNKNVKFSAGAGVVTFSESTGSLTGPSFEIDDASATTGRVRWTNAGLRWTGLGGDNNWNTATNWSGNAVPTAADTVVLDHSTVLGAYTVNLATGANGSCARLTIDKGASANAIGLTLNGTNTLTVADNVSIQTGCTITTTTTSNTINVAGNWTIAAGATYTCGSGKVLFNPSLGTKTISPGASSFFNLTINGSSGTTVTTAAAITILNDLNISSGTLDVTAGNFAIDIKGNWTQGSSSVFNPRAGTVTFSKTGTSTQTINAGTFFNITTSSVAATGTKQFTGNASIANNLIIGANTIVDAGANTLTVNGAFTNNASTSGYSQSGIGSIVFGGINQAIDNGAFASTFNFVTVQGTGTKTWGRASTINGDLTIASTVGAVDLQTFILTAPGAANTFTVAGATNVTLRGANNFPSGFEILSIASNSTFTYNSDIAQSIFAVPSPGYGNLTVQKTTLSGSVTKSALGNLIVTGALTINDAFTTLDMATANANITLTGNLALATGGPQITWGSTSTIDHVGAAWNIDVDITTFNNLTLSGSGVKLMQSNLTVNGNFVANNTTSLTMQAFTMNCPGASKTFTLNAGSTLNSAIPQATGVAFPTGFTTYTLDVTSLVLLNSANGVNQLIRTANVTYGNLQFSNNTKNATIDAAANLAIAGNFTGTTATSPAAAATLIDNSKDITIAGNASFCDYTPTATVTVTFNGNAAQTIQDIYSTTLDLPVVAFSGTGLKTFGGGNDDITISGNLTNATGSSVTCARNIFFTGANWTNSGSFLQTASTATFNRATAQTIIAGTTNAFFNVDFQNTGTKTFSTNNVDFNGATFNIAAGTTVDMGTLTHTIFATTITNSGTWTTTNTSLTFDGAAQSIPAITARDIICANTNTKTLAGNWIIRNLTINSGVTLNTSASNFNITLTGSWTNSGTFTPNSSTVLFNGATTPITINNNASAFYIANFTPTVAVTYNLTGTSTLISLSSNIGANAYLNLNGKTLILGSNQAAGKTITVAGTLDVNPLAFLKFDNTTSIVTMNVTGTLKVVGASAQVATITRQTTGGQQINITTGTIHAKNYLIEFLSDNGLDVQATATLDATNNFSDGTWSNMRVGGVGVRRYLILNCTSPGTNIANTIFNYSAAPVIATEFNVQRSSGATGVVNFVSALGGAIGDFSFEDDGLPTSATLGKLTWPTVTSVTWTGTTNTDWHTATNWTPNTVPDNTISAIVPLVTNNPIISTANATCKDLTISNGQVSLQGGFSLTTSGNISIGTGASVGVLTVGSSSSQINCAGNWTRGANGVFSHGSSTVNFTGSTGASTVTPLTSPFFNVTFNNSTSVFSLVGATVTFAGSLTILTGQLFPSTANYTYNVAGNFICTGAAGTFNTTTVGIVNLNGAAQTITDATFNSLTVAGTGTKTTSGNISIANNLIVTSTLAAGGASVITMNGNVTINSLGTFNDGGNSHSFFGTTWTGTGAYTGAGTITFARTTGAQTLVGGTFNNLTFNNGNQSVTITANVSIRGNFFISNNINTCIINSGVTVASTNAAGTFTLETNEFLFCRGTNSFPTNFGTYDIQTASTVTYDGTLAQNIFNTDYGNLTLANAFVKTLLGDINIKNVLNIGATGSTLDVTASNFDITIQGNWSNNSNGIFLPHTANVTFNGTAANQSILIGVSATNPFANITVDKAATTLLNNNSNISISNDLTVTTGIHSNNGFITTIGANMVATGGTFAQSGTYTLTNAGGNINIQTNSSILNNLTINGSGTTFTCVDNLSAVGAFNLLAGTLDGNGKVVNLGDNGDAVLINGTYKIGPGGSMALGNNVTTSVNGTIEVVGTNSNIATVTRNIIGGVGSRYSTFQINNGGTIKAQFYLFEYMGSGGILVNNGATINTTNNFSDGTFSNGIASGIFLQVENNQRLTLSHRINNVSFPINPGGSSANVKKVSATSDTLDFFNATGVFAGESFDADNNNYINWDGPITLTWNGSVSTDWYTAGNWTASSGPNIVPTGAENVIIATAANQPLINVAGALTKNLTINTGATLTITTTTSALSDLTINGDITINGTLTMSSTNDGILVSGNWQKAGAATVNILNGTVNFNSTISKNINNGTASFGFVIISGATTYTLGANTIISKDLTIATGATLDFTSTNFNLTVGGNLLVSGTIIPRSGKLTLNAASGTKTLNAGATTVLFNLDINAGASTVYNITTNNLATSNTVNIIAGTLNLNGKIFTMGDNVGADFLSVSGTLIINGGATLKVGTNASVAVNSGGTFQVVGSSSSSIATITRKSAGTYNFAVNTGGNFAARFYLIEFMGTAGLVINTGVNIDATNNFSDGTFQNGAATGKYLQVDATLGAGAGISVSNVVFNSGPAINCSRTTGSGNLTFIDASGPLGSQSFEQDDQAISATAGLIRWTFTNPNVTWTGVTSTQWQDVTNWSPAIKPNGGTNVIIPNVTGASNNNPVINTASDSGTVNNLTIYAGGVLTLSNNKGIDILGNLSNSGTITVSAASTSLINISGNWTDNGTFTPSSSTVVFKATSGTKTILSGAASTFKNITFNGAATFTLSNALTASGNLTISAGTLDVSASNFGLTVKGNWSNSGTFNARSGLVTFSGTSAQTISGTNTFFSATMTNNTGISLTASSSQSLQNILTLSGNTVLTTTSATLTFLSTSTRTAKLAKLSGSAGITGNIVMQRFAPGGKTGWSFLSAPVTTTIQDWKDDFTMSGFTGVSSAGGFVSVYTYNETATGANTNGYIAATNTTNPITPGKGFWVYLGTGQTTTNDINIDVTGVPFKGTKNFGVTFTSSGGATEDGWNMVANPYPCEIDWQAASGWTRTHLNSTIYTYNADNANYATYTLGGAATNGGSRYIASSQAFWVQTNASSPSLIATENVKITTQNPTFLRMNNITNDPLKMLTLRVVANGYQDESVIVLNPDATWNFEGDKDAYKMFNDVPASPNLSSVVGGIDYTVNSIPDANHGIQIPIRTKMGQTSQVTMSWSGLESFPSTGCLLIEDLYTGTVTDIRNIPDYTFTLSDTTNAPRFLLKYTNSGEVNVIADACNGVSNGIISLGSAGTTYSYDVKDTSGNIISSQNNLTTVATINNIPAGLYVATINDINSLCGVTVDTFEVVLQNTIIADFATDKDTVYVDVDPVLSLTNLSNGSQNLVWNFGDGNSSTDLNPTHEYSLSGNYTVSLIAGTGACADTITKHVIVVGSSAGVKQNLKDDLNIYANGDGINIASNANYKNAEITLFDAVGRIVLYKQMSVNAGSNPISVGNVSEGIYMVQVKSGSQIIQKKIKL